MRIHKRYIITHAVLMKYKDILQKAKTEYQEKVDRQEKLNKMLYNIMKLTEKERKQCNYLKMIRERQQRENSICGLTEKIKILEQILKDIEKGEKIDDN